MLIALLMCSGSLATSPPDQVASPRDLAAYEAFRENVGRSAEAHVELALWCEAHGLKAEQLKHLSLAVLMDPRSAWARGLMGLVAYHGRWQRPDAVADKVKADEALTAKLAEYNARRSRLRETADANWDLAVWCEQNALQAEAKAHFTVVTRLDPLREAAWKRLGCKKHNGRWLTDAQVSREKEEADHQKHADKKWRPLLEKWRGLLTGKDPEKRTDVERRLAEVTDPRAVPMVWEVFATGDEASQKVAVQVLGQIDVAGASRALATLALFSKSPEVRRTATETLRRRDAREYAGLLIAMFREPIKYEVRQVEGPGSVGTLFIEGQRVNVERRYRSPPPPWLNRPFGPGDLLIYDADGLPAVVRMRFAGSGMATFNPDGSYVMFGSAVGTLLPPSQPAPAFIQQMIEDPGQAASILSRNTGKGINSPSVVANQRAYQLMQQGFGHVNANGATNTILLGRAIQETWRAAANAQQQLMDDVATLDRYNREAEQSNQEVVRVLNGATGRDLPAERKTWLGWLTDQFGYAQRFSQPTKTTMVEEISQPLPPIAGFDTNENGYARIISCFGAGTLVHTLTGPRPIETLRVGDEVLTQDVKTAALGYQPILVIHHNPPSKTFRIRLDGETIVSSEFHRFWTVGKGWVMARDLKLGDTLRMLGGQARVGSVEPGTVQPVFNLDVAENADFFAGERGALVHDNTLPDTRLAPFDAARGVAGITSVN